MIRFFTTRLRCRCRVLPTLLAVSLLLAGHASAVDILVTTDADSGAGSLREALTAAASGDRVVFDIPGTPTIVLLSNLPDVAVDISFANNNAIDVTIDRNGFGPLNFIGPSVDPSVLVVNTGGGPSADNDIVGSATTTVFGAGTVRGNLQVAGTLAPGANASPGTVGTLTVTGDTDLSNAQVQLDIVGSPAASDLLSVTGTATVTGATLAPNFVGSDFTIGQQFLVLDTTNPIVGLFANQTDTFQLPNNPFLQAVEDLTLGADDFGFVIEDNGNSFASAVIGCNQTSAALLLDDLQASATPPASVIALREGSTDQVLNAVNQLSGSIYASLMGAEVNHVQNNLESVRDLIVLHARPDANELTLTPWVRGYGVEGRVNPDDCQTVGYRQRLGGVELGCGIGGGGGLAAHIFSHLSGGSIDARSVDQSADVNAYRLGGSVLYTGQHVYLLALGGGGTQDYDVRRSLSEFQGSSFAQSSFDGTSAFGYFEVALVGNWTPYLALQTTRIEIDPIRETGDPDFALTNRGGSQDSLRGILGFAFNKSAMTGLGLATTRVRFGWTHEYRDEFSTLISQVADGGTPTGTLVDQGVSAGSDYAFTRVQVEWGHFLGGQLMGAYQGQFNRRSYFSSLIGGAGWAY